MSHPRDTVLMQPFNNPITQCYNKTLSNRLLYIYTYKYKLMEYTGCFLPPPLKEQKPEKSGFLLILCLENTPNNNISMIKKHTKYIIIHMQKIHHKCIMNPRVI